MKYLKKKSLIHSFTLLIVAAAFLTGCSWFNASAKVEKQLELGVKYLSENKYEEAVLAYNDVIKVDSKNSTAYKGLSRAYELQGKFSEAEKTLQDGFNKVVDKNQMKLCLASIYIDQGKNNLAEKTYTELIAVDKSLLVAYEGMAQILINQGRVDEAVKIATQCIQSNSASEKSYNLLAGVYINKKDQNQVLSLISQSLKINLNQQAAYLILEVLYNRDWNRIIQFGQTLSSSDETAGRTLKIYAYNKSGQYNKSVEEFLSLKDKSSRADKARALTAISYLKTEEAKSAERLISEINLKGSKNPLLYADIARYYLEAGDLEQSRKISLEGIALDDTCEENYYVMIEAANKKNQADAVYYSYLLLVCSTDTARNLAEDFRPYGIDIKIPGVEEKTNLGQIGNKPLSKEDFSLGGISLGMKKSQVIAILGQPWGEAKPGTEFREMFYRGGLTVNCLTDTVYEISVFGGDYKAGYRTARGLQAGDNIRKLYELYGEPEKIESHTNGNGADKDLHYYNPTNKERYFVFGVKDDIVTEIYVLGPLP